MKNLWLLAAMVMLLTGCGGDKQKKEDLSKEEVIDGLMGTISEIDSYKMDLQINTVTALEGEDKKGESINGEVIVADFDAPEMHVRYDTAPSVVTQEKPAAFEYYQAGERIVLNKGDGWKNASGEDISADELPNIRYEPIILLFRDIGNDMDIIENKENYVVSYEGDSQSISNTLKTALSIEFQEVDPEEVISDLKVIVDREKLRMKEFHYSAQGKELGNSETVEYHFYYHHFNEVDGISIPEEILDEMSGTTTH